MKKFLITITMFIVILLGGCTTHNILVTSPDNHYKVNLPSSAGNTDIDFQFSLKQTNYKETVQVYKFEKPDVNIEYVRDISSKLGLNEITEGTENFLSQDKEKGLALEIYKQTGAICYFANWHSLDSPNLPSEEEAINLAKDFLAKIDLMPVDNYTIKVGVGETAGGVPQTLSVNFVREIDGFNYCPNAAFDVRVGSDGKIVETYINPVKHSPYDVVHIKTPEQAFQTLKSGKHFMSSGNTQKVSVESAQIKYWLEPIAKGQDYIVPVYEFSGKCFDAAGKEVQGEFTGWVEAVQ